MTFSNLNVPPVYYADLQSKNQRMRFVVIFASALVSGSYYSGGGSSDINALTRKKALDVQFTPHRHHPVLGVKTSQWYRSICEWLLSVR
jgi:hypothetical protein